MEVIYRPGKSNIADPLSRLASTDSSFGKTFNECTEYYVHWVTSNAMPVALKITDIKQASSEVDKSIQSVRDGLDQDVWSEDATSFKLLATPNCVLLEDTAMTMRNANSYSRSFENGSFRLGT